MIADLTTIHAETIELGGHHEGLGAHGVDVALDVRPTSFNPGDQPTGWRAAFMSAAQGITAPHATAAELASKAGGIEGVKILSTPGR